MNSQTMFDPSDALPRDINGWAPLHEDRIYQQDDLYDYIDGGAELFLSYGFEKVYNRIYVRENQPDIFVDIFFMNSSKDAFGVFSHSRETIENVWGAGSQYTEGAILFWKSNIYVSILTNPETPQAKETIFKIAQIISDSITGKSNLPEVLNKLPREDLIEENIRYFRHHIWLNSFYYVSHENLLNISQDTEAVLAKYNFKDDHPILVIIDYPDSDAAHTAYKKFMNAFIPESKNGEPYIIEDGTYTGSLLDKNTIYTVFDARNINSVTELLGKVENK